LAKLSQVRSVRAKRSGSGCGAVLGEDR